jgi:hypothetical protein
MALPAGQISGTVTSASGKAALKGIEVCATLPGEEFEGESCETTDAAGEYTIAKLPSGGYHVEFYVPFESGLNYVTQYYNHKPSFSEAELVTVTAPNTTTGIDAELEAGGSIAGKVTDASTGAPVTGAFVCAGQEGTGSLFGGCAITGASGEYSITGLPTGSYKVEFSGREYVLQYYSGKLSLSAGDTVLVTAPNTTPGIDAALQLVGTPPANTTPPVISGAPAVGATLLCANGLWTGKPAPSFTQQWLRDGAPIPGAIGGSYLVQSADAGHNVSCLVTAKNSKGSKTASSASVAIPAPPPPPPPPAPTVLLTGSKIVVSGSSAKVKLACGNATCQGSVELFVQIVLKSHKGRKAASHKSLLVLAKGSYSIAPGKSAIVVLHLTAVGAKRLAHAKHHPVSAKLELSVKGGVGSVKPVRVT